MDSDITREGLEEWLRQEWNNKPASNQPRDGELTRKQIKKMLGLSESISKEFVHTLVEQGKMTMRKAGSQCFYKKVEIGT